MMCPQSILATLIACNQILSAVHVLYIAMPSSRFINAPLKGGTGLFAYANTHPAPLYQSPFSFCPVNHLTPNDRHIGRTAKLTSRRCILYIECPTRYRTRHFLIILPLMGIMQRNCNTHYRHIPFHFSHNERTPVQIYYHIINYLLLLKKCRVR